MKKKTATNKSKFDKLGFEPVSSSLSNNLIGGFSQSISQIEPITIGDGASNNCLGGNCTYACSNQQNVQCNAHTGCG